jgi:hypothetical protein
MNISQSVPVMKSLVIKSSQSEPAIAKSSSKVHFNEDSTKTILVDTVTSSQRNAVWYTLDELKTIKKASREEDTFVNRSSLRKVRHNFIQTILEQQSEHQTRGTADPKELFALSSVCSKVSRKTAQTAAIRVAQEVLSEDF